MSISVGVYNPFADLPENSALRSNVATIRRTMYDHDRLAAEEETAVCIPPMAPILNANVEHNAPLSRFHTTTERGPAYRTNTEYNPSRYVDTSTVLLTNEDDSLDRTHTLTTSVLEEMGTEALDGNEMGPSAIDYAMAERERTLERRLAKENRVREFNRAVAQRAQKAQKHLKAKEMERQKALKRMEQRVMETYRSSVRSMVQSVSAVEVEAEEAGSGSNGDPIDQLEAMGMDSSSEEREREESTGSDNESSDSDGGDGVVEGGGIEMALNEAVVQVDRRPEAQNQLQRSTIGKIEEAGEEMDAEYGETTEGAATVWPVTPIRRHVQKKTTESAWARGVLLSHKTRAIDSSTTQTQPLVSTVPGASAGLHISMHHTHTDRDGLDIEVNEEEEEEEEEEESRQIQVRNPGQVFSSGLQVPISGSGAPSVTSLVVHAGSETTQDQDIDVASAVRDAKKAHRHGHGHAGGGRDNSDEDDDSASDGDYRDNIGPDEARKLRALIRDSEMALERTRIRATVLLKEEKKRQMIEEKQRRIAEKKRIEEERRMETIRAAEERKAKAQAEMQRLRDLKTHQRELMREAATGKVMERYIEALRFELIKKIEKKGAHIPPLCACGIDPLDPDARHGDNCSYKLHPQQYVRALSDVLHSLKML